MDDLKKALKHGKERFAPWTQILETKPSEDELDALQKKVEKVRQRASSDLGPELRSWYEELRGAVNSVVEAQNAGFKRLEVEFLSSLRQQGVPTTELNAGWRVGSLVGSPVGFWDRGVLDLNLKRESAQLSVSSNGAVLIKDRRIRKLADFEKAAEAAYSELSRFSSKAVPDELLGELFYQAYQQARQETKESFVTLHAVARAFRLRLLTRAMEGRGFQAADPLPELTSWGLSHLLDRYALLGLSIPSEKRLIFEPGSQETIRKGLGVTLTHHHNQKVICFVRAAN